MLHGEFRDARLVAVYDAEFGWARDDDFFLALGMAAAGHTVTGVDPAPASLRTARVKPGAEQVSCLVGPSSCTPR